MPRKQLTWPREEVKRWLASRPETNEQIAEAFGIATSMIYYYQRHGATEQFHRQAAMFDALHPRRQVRLDYLSPEDRAKAID